MKPIILALLFSASIIKAQTPQPTPPAHPVTREQLHELFTVTHSIDNAHQMMRQMVNTMQTSAPPYLPKAFWDDFRVELDKLDLEATMSPAYEKYFSTEDMQQILTFYKSPAGKHLLETQPLISAAAAEAVKTSGNQIGNQVAQRYAAEIAAGKKKYDDEHLTAPTPAPKPN